MTNPRIPQNFIQRILQIPPQNGTVFIVDHRLDEYYQQFPRLASCSYLTNAIGRQARANRGRIDGGTDRLGKHQRVQIGP